MLFNEPKLLKLKLQFERTPTAVCGFSALQRAEIAEIVLASARRMRRDRGFSALQRAEIAEMLEQDGRDRTASAVSVLFNEPKLLKCGDGDGA